MGVARQRQAIVNGLRDSIKNFSNDISDVGSRDVIEMVCFSRSLPACGTPSCLHIGACQPAHAYMRCGLNQKKLLEQ